VQAIVADHGAVGFKTEQGGLQVKGQWDESSLWQFGKKWERL